jgi:diguanylate cyclase (GGDEF)-like protein
MPRSGWLRLLSLAAIGFAVAASAWVVFVRPVAYLEELLFFIALVALVSFFTIESEQVTFGFEAGVIFPAIVLLHDPAVALISGFAGLTIWQLRKPSLRTLHGPALLGISYFIVALLYASAVDRNAHLLAKISGYVLLVVGFLALRIAFLAASGAPKHLMLLQTQIVAVITPVVALEVMSFLGYGPVGFAIAFLPLLVIAYAMRREAQISERNAELMHRNRELSILTESATAILTAETEGGTIRQMVALVGRLARLKAAAVITWESKPVRGSTVYRFGECLLSDQDLVRWVRSTGFAQSAPTRPLVFRDELRRFPLAAGPAIQVVLGIQTPDAIYGVLVYETEDPAILQTGSLNLLTLLLKQIAVSLQDQLLRVGMAAKNSELERHASTMSTLLDLSTSLISSTDIEESLTRVANAVRDALGFDMVIFSIFDSRRDEFIRRAQAGVDPAWKRMRKKPIPAREILQFFKPEFRISNSYFVSHRGPDAWRENDVLLVPLMSGEKLMGYLSVQNPRDGRLPQVERIKTLEIFAVQAVMALESAHHFEEIRRLTFIDGLTPAYNFRYFQETLEKELHRHHRSGHQLTLGMLDIDNFKLINDTFGHPVGDEVLKGFVEELMKNARDTDVVARYGGEEFALIFPETPLASARDAANRLRDLIERREFAVPQVGRTLRVTASIGVAVYPSDGQTSTDLIARADAALYFAKKNGKNQVAMASDVPDEGTGSAGA